MQVVVVGGGLAGCWAAVTAAEQGAQVTLVSRAPGATALYAGAMEIAPDLEEVMMTEPYHPYRRLYRDHLRLAADLETVTQEFKARLGRVGFRLAGAWNREGRFPDLYGGVRRGQLVPASVEPGEVDGLRGKRVAVVGVEGMSHPPWDASVREGRLYGRGSSDMKAGVAAMSAAAARAVSASGGTVDGEIIVTAVVDEEYSSLGTRALISEGVRADAAILNEAGIPAICFGPGDIALAHAAEEFVRVDEIERATLVLAALAMEWTRKGA